MRGQTSEVHEKIAEAQDLSREAERLVAEVEEELKQTVLEQDGVNGEVSVDYKPDDDAFRVTISDQDIVDAVSNVAGDDVTVFGNMMSIEIVTEEDLLPRLGGQPETMKEVVQAVERDHEDGAPLEEVVSRAQNVGYTDEGAREEIETLRTKGELYAIDDGKLRSI